METWEKLLGEIDFDSVLVASSLRVSRPDVFTLIEENVSVFQNGFSNPFATGNREQESHPVELQLEALLEREPTPRLQKAIKKMIGFVFPAVSLGGKRDGRCVECPQGLCEDGHADYWRRYLTLPTISVADSDQAALRNIALWKQNKENDLVARLLNSHHAAQIEAFVGQFSAWELCRLLTETTESLRECSTSGWENAMHPPGITSIWRMMLRKPPSPDMLCDTLKQLISSTTGCHLPLINDILYFFTASEGRVPQLLHDEDIKQVDEFFYDTVRKCFPRGSGVQLLQALQFGSPYIAFWICQRLAGIQDTEAEFESLEYWTEFSAVLLEAAEYNPEHGLPLIVPFVTDGSMQSDFEAVDESGNRRPTQFWDAQFLEAKAKQLFDFDRLVTLLSNTERPEHLGPQMSAQYDAAREAALSCAEEGPSVSEPVVDDGTEQTEKDI